jgi:hypothetical protein
MRRLRGVLPIAVTLGLALGTSSTARADRKSSTPASPASKAACVQAHDRAQTSASDRRLKSAREDFLECAKDACPSIVREDCSRSLTEVDAVIPSVVFSATAEGGDVSDVRVLLDGAVVTEHIDGRARDVDPGPHVVRFERSGNAPIEVRVVAREGDKNRVVTASYAPARIFTPVPAIREERRLPMVPLVIAGFGLAAIGTGTYLRVRTDADAADMQRRCAPTCDPADRDALSDRIAMSNVSLAVGIGAIGVSAILWLLDPRH